MKKVLIANRGEIAIRVIRAAHALGMKAAVVYSTIDRESRAVRLADEAIDIGGPESRSSYLDQDKVLAAARTLGADAIHPGYGFLSENADFARAVVAAGITWVGPNPEAIEAMGDKINSRRRMIAAGVPVVPGEERETFTEKELLEAARRIGYPVMLKATAGGGGKGIRIVHEEKDLWSAYQRTTSEAQKAFGDGIVFIEKAVEGPHHVEFQVFGDRHGNVVHLFERECSVQRRHQKVLEESPSPFLTPELRAAMAEAAVTAARSIGYDNAGTIEFLVDRHRKFYFLEMNTRLQVEHPVTELVLGVDLVTEQLKVAGGERLSFRQEALAQRGHAVEVRICAEDPENDWLPSVGRVSGMTLPAGPGVRIDSALTPGLEVSLYYDSMLAKLICHGADRAEAFVRLRQALSEFKVAGIDTNIPFLGAIVRDPEILAGRYDTGFLGSFERPKMRPDLLDAALVAAALARHTATATGGPAAGSGKAAGQDPWRLVGRLRGVRRS